MVKREKGKKRAKRGREGRRLAVGGSRVEV